MCRLEDYRYRPWDISRRFVGTAVGDIHLGGGGEGLKVNVHTPLPSLHPIIAIRGPK